LGNDKELDGQTSPSIAAHDDEIKYALHMQAARA
jgi:hypothetical protein